MFTATSVPIAALLISIMACAPANAPRGAKAETGATAETNAAETGREAAGASEVATSAPLAAAGAWRAAETKAEKTARTQSIEDVTATLGRLKRSAVRSRITEQTAPANRLEIELQGKFVSVAADDRRIRCDIGGAQETIAIEGETFQVSAMIENGGLKVQVSGKAQSRTTIYQAEGDTLTASVTLTSDRLARPLRYASTYLRVQ